MSKVCIIDYKGGNIFSVQNTVNTVGADSFLSSDPDEIRRAKKIIFPGVGSFESSMQHINELGLADVIKEKALDRTPFLGVCVGMQVLFESSTEAKNGSSKGLGIFAGSFSKFDFDKINANSNQKLNIPHMGWNQIESNLNGEVKSPLFKGINSKSSFYFVHSFMTEIEPSAIQKNQEKFPKLEILRSNYGQDFISSIWNGENLYACQFHPEKSGENGLQLIKNFIDL